MATKSANVMARVEPDIKAKAEAILARLGILASVVINVLYHQIIYTNSIPFPLSLPSKIPSLETMTEQEFDSMLESSLTQANNGEGRPLDETLASLRTKKEQ